MANMIFRQTGRRPAKVWHMQIVSEAANTTFDEYAPIVDHLWHKLVSLPDGSSLIELHPTVT